MCRLIRAAQSSAARGLRVDKGYVGASLAVDVQCYAKSYLQEEEDRDDIDNEYFACFADAAALKRSSVLYCEVHEAANPPPIPVVWTKLLPQARSSLRGPFTMSKRTCHRLLRQ